MSISSTLELRDQFLGTASEPPGSLLAQTEGFFSYFPAGYDVKDCFLAIQYRIHVMYVALLNAPIGVQIAEMSPPPPTFPTL